MPEYYKLIYSSYQDIPDSFYNTFMVISKLEFPQYQEILIVRPYHFSKTKIMQVLLLKDLPLPLYISQIYDRGRTNIDSPLHYSIQELNKLKYWNIKYMYYDNK